MLPEGQRQGERNLKKELNLHKAFQERSFYGFSLLIHSSLIHQKYFVSILF